MRGACVRKARLKGASVEQTKFRLPRSSFAELSKIVAAYANFGDPAPLDELAKLAVINRTIVSSNNAFLSAVGLVEGGKAKQPTHLGKQLGLAITHCVGNEEASAWREVVTGNDFLSKLVLAVKIRKGMDQTALESHIAFSSGERKTPQVMAGARAVVEILLRSGLLRVNDEGIVEVAEPTATPPAPPQDIPSAATEAQESPVSPHDDTPRDLSISVRVNINATPEQMEGLAQKVRTLLAELRAPRET